MIKYIDPTSLGLPSRTTVEEIDSNTLAIVIQRKSRIIMADGIKILALVFEKYGHTSTQIKDGLYSIKNYSGVGGNLSFDEYGDVIKPVSFKTIKNGEFVKYPEL